MDMQVFSYTDYRKLVLDYFQARKAMPAGFSWREFAKECGYASPVYLKLVTEEKSNLSEVGVERVAAAIGLTGRELQYFRILVRFNQASASRDKKQAFAELRDLATKAEVTTLQADQYDYYQSWYNAAIRELAPSMPGATPEQLGEALFPKVSAAKVRKSLELLERIGLLVKSESVYVQTSQSISTGSEVTSLSVRDMHRQMAELAMDSLDSVAREQRDISGLTLGLSAEAFERVVREMAEFRRRLVAIATEDTRTDRVYRVNLQVFPVSESIGLPGGEA